MAKWLFIIEPFCEYSKATVLFWDSCFLIQQSARALSNGCKSLSRPDSGEAMAPQKITGENYEKQININKFRLYYLGCLYIVYFHVMLSRI